MLEAVFAQTTNHIIGGNNKLPWNDKKYKEITKWDMQKFVENTKNKHIIMGWNTWMSLGEKPLKDRGIHLIVTSKNTPKRYPYRVYDIPRVKCITLEQLKNIINETKDEDFIIIGGPSLIDEFYFALDKVYITTFEFPDFYGKENEYDTFAPLTLRNMSKLEWEIITKSNLSFEQKGNEVISGEYIEYQRIKHF